MQKKARKLYTLSGPGTVSFGQEGLEFRMADFLHIVLGSSGNGQSFGYSKVRVTLRSLTDTGARRGRKRPGPATE